MSRKGSFDWTIEARVALRHLWEDARDEDGELLSGSEVGRRLSERFGHPISASAAIGKAHRMGLAARPSPIQGAPRGASKGAGAVEKARKRARVQVSRGAGGLAVALANSRGASAALQTPPPVPETAPVFGRAPAAIPPAARDGFGEVGCRWPLEQDPVSRLWRYCDAPRIVPPGRDRLGPYCACHDAKAYVRSVVRPDVEEAA